MPFFQYLKKGEKMEKKIFEYKQGERSFIVEVGELAKQANGAVFIKFDDTAVLSATVMGKDAIIADFFPLTVVYQEKLYAAGKIPGGFLRREGRPSEHETLTSRLIDRPLRPLFADGFRNEVQVINTVMSANPDNSPAMTALIGASLALCISDIPFNGPIAGVVVGLINGEYILNPTLEQLEKSDLNLTVAGTIKAINMVEASAKQVDEKVMLGALMFAQKEITKICKWENEIIKEVGKVKKEIEYRIIEKKFKEAIYKYSQKRLIDAIIIEEKQARGDAIESIKEETRTYFEKIWKNDKLDKDEVNDKFLYLNETLEMIVADEVRRLIIEDQIRPDGRKLDEIRPLSSRIDILERVHGSSLFTRGQTQVLGTVTLGSLRENQIIDGLGIEDTKRFMLHYNFPQFSVGETGRYGSPGRREVGHGALGEKALLQVIPPESEFPYTIRIVTEVLESNGSSSQASICAGTLALMAAGVPIIAPIAGIAMGLVSDNKKHIILSDIQGLEDHFGDMDFKVAGTKEGICALQMDIKITGIDEKILKEALEEARIGRLFILEHMNATICKPREELSAYAPKVIMFTIDPDKIRDVIGAGGKVINELIATCNEVKIDIEQDGRVSVMHQDLKWALLAKEKIENIVRVAEVNKIYNGKVTRIEKFGAFVELWQGCEGLLHISKISETRVENVEDVLSLGDEISVKVIGIDDKGRVDLTRKNLFDDTPVEKNTKPQDLHRKKDKFHKDKNNRFNKEKNQNK